MDFKRIFGWAVVLVFLLAAKAYLNDDSSIAGRGDDGADNVTYVDRLDPEMNKARASAEASLPQFLEHAAAGQLEQPLLKVAFSTVNGLEHIWVEEFAAAETGGFYGYLANEPVAIEGASYGSRVEFTRLMISDWAFTENGRGYGFFTVRAILPGMDAQTRAQTVAFLSPDPVPEGW